MGPDGATDGGRPVRGEGPEREDHSGQIRGEGANGARGRCRGGGMGWRQASRAHITIPRSAATRLEGCHVSILRQRGLARIASLQRKATKYELLVAVHSDPRYPVRNIGEFPLHLIDLLPEIGVASSHASPRIQPFGQTVHIAQSGIGPD